MVSSAAPFELLQLRAELAAARAQAKSAHTKALEAEAEAARIKAINADLEVRNAWLELMNEKMRRDKYGASSERSRCLLDQLELTFEDLEADATEDEILGEVAAARTTTVAAFARPRARRRDFPANLPREQVVIPAPERCPCCGSQDLSQLPPVLTETLEKIPARHKVIQTIRQKVSCRQCEKISQPPAPFHATPRGMFGPHFLASLVFQKYGLHQPLNSQRDRLESEGIALSLSTLADQVGAVSVALMPVFRLIEAHVLAAERLRVRQRRTAPLVGALETWLRAQRETLSRHDPVAKAIAYLLNDWDGFTNFLKDGRICLTNNAAERELRSVARGRKAWLFVGSDRGGERAAMLYSLINTARLNSVDPLAWLTDVLARMADLPQGRLSELLPWNWKALQHATLAGQNA